MLRRALLCALAMMLVGVAPALASPRSDHDSRHRTLTSWADHRGNDRERPTDHVWDRYNSRNDDDSDSWDDDSDSSDESSDDNTDSGTSDTGTDTTTPVTGSGAVAGAPVPTPTGAEQRQTFRITGFGKKDNTPPGSTTISQGVIHSQAGGTGTAADPLTAASPGSAGSTESPKGTRFYVPHISRYVIVEDSGASKFSQPHLDIWSGTTDNVEDCEGKITGTFEVIRNPKPNYPVKAGPIATGSGCNL